MTEQSRRQPNGRDRTQPNGRRVMELRKKNELKQHVFAKDIGISERLLRDIERKNYPVPLTTITNIAAALKVSPGEITLSTAHASPPRSGSLLKLRAVSSAVELSTMAISAWTYRWVLKTDPSAHTALFMQEMLTIVRRLVDKFGQTDAYDSEEFGEIPRIARLQLVLDTLRENDVGVIAGAYTYSRLREPKPDDEEIFLTYVRVPGKPKQILERETRLVIHFVKCDVKEEIVRIHTGVSVADSDIERPSW
jgi:transcriptional regulator with XRE-family HTH domain